MPYWELRKETWLRFGSVRVMSIHSSSVNKADSSGNNALCDQKGISGKNIFISEYSHTNIRSCNKSWKMFYQIPHFIITKSQYCIHKDGVQASKHNHASPFHSFIILSYHSVFSYTNLKMSCLHIVPMMTNCPLYTYRSIHLLGRSKFLFSVCNPLFDLKFTSLRSNKDVSSDMQVIQRLMMQ